MTEKLAEELLAAIEEDRLYGFIANNYTKLNKYELARIAMELYFVYFVRHRKQTGASKEELIDGLREEFVDD